MNPKTKGQNGETRFTRFLREHGIKAYRDKQSGAGLDKSDVTTAINAHFEVKTVKSLNLQQAWRQSVKSTGHYETSYLVVQFDGMAANQWLIVMDAEEWADTWHKAQEPKTTKSENRDLRYKLERLISYTKELIKRHFQYLL